MREDIRRTDPLTGEKFFATRANQKFARPENRIKFNNDAANALKKERENINKPIHNAHVKLRKLMVGKNEAEFSLDFLRGYGLNFNVFNHYVFFNGIQRPAIFEFMFNIDKVNKKVKIIRHGRF
ncbi:MAG: hypothetical protein RIQ59_188 [Bacteroidota bacterium]|jgi:hypothetical protein